MFLNAILIDIKCRQADIFSKDDSAKIFASIYFAIQLIKQ